VEDQGSGDGQLGDQRTEREGWVDHDQIWIKAIDRMLDRSKGPSRREVERRTAHPFDLDPPLPLLLIKRVSTRIRSSGEHSKRFGVQSTPELPEVALDASDLRREVVRDQKVTALGHQLGLLGLISHRSPLEPERRDKTCLSQHPDRAGLSGVDDEGIIRLSPKDEGDDAVAARVVLLAAAPFAVHRDACIHRFVPLGCPTIVGLSAFEVIMTWGCDAMSAEVSSWIHPNGL
jgi:hypothetical protein